MQATTRLKDLGELTAHRDSQDLLIMGYNLTATISRRWVVRSKHRVEALAISQNNI